MSLYIKGKFKKIIYQNEESNYVVTLFRLSETNDPKMKEFNKKTITVTGVIPNLKLEASYVLQGNYINHDKYSWQYSVSLYELEKLTDKDAIEEFLASSFVSGCGKTTAKKIVDLLGVKALDKIKEDYNVLMDIKGMTAVKALKIYSSILKY